MNRISSTRENHSTLKGLSLLTKQHRVEMIANSLPFACEGLKSPISLAPVSGEKLSATEQKRCSQLN